MGAGLSLFILLTLLASSQGTGKVWKARHLGAQDKGPRKGMREMEAP